MLAGNGRLKIAIQGSGRIADESAALLRAAGMDFRSAGRSLFFPCENFPLDVLSLRDDDIPEYVQDGVSDLGIVGANVVREKRARVEVLTGLGFGKCRLSICVPKRSRVKSVEELRGKRIATSYPRMLGEFLRSRGVRAEIIEISGSVELTPSLDVADAICDLVSTGSTARVNGLAPLMTVMESEAVLITNKRSLVSHRHREAIGQLRTRIESCLRARGKKYVMMNAPLDATDRIRRLVPGMRSPTIVPLANSNMVAVHSVVGEEVFWDVIDRLKKAGAVDIVVVPIEKIIA